MTARDQLADRIALILDPDALDPVAQEVARNVADAVIGMVGPLIWQRNGNHHAGGYGFVIRKIGGTYVLTMRNLHDQGYDTLEAAKSAANAHHVAQWLNGIGLDA